MKKSSESVMKLGWIDFSKTERSKILSILESPSEDSTLDELGIAPIRDGFANLLFPGTSTIQTRAKYFLIVPYAIRDLESSGETDPKEMSTKLSEKERECGKSLLDDVKKRKGSAEHEGVIGRRSLENNKWVSREPSDIYWSGIKRYEIFRRKDISLPEYIRYVCESRKEKNDLSSLGNRNDGADGNDQDDSDAGKGSSENFWSLPTYNKDWANNLTIELTCEEAGFLKERIIESCKGSMLSYILENKMTEITDMTFEGLEGIIGRFPRDIQNIYGMARKFSEFVYALRVMYNVIVSNGQNESANEEWDKIEPKLKEIADIDMDWLYTRFNINSSLGKFLNVSKKNMLEDDVDSLKRTITSREFDLKGARAKTKHPGELDTSKWYGGGHLSYRFETAKTILRDIFEGEKSHA